MIVPACVVLEQHMSSTDGPCLTRFDRELLFPLPMFDQVHELVFLLPMFDHI